MTAFIALVYNMGTSSVRYVNVIDPEDEVLVAELAQRSSMNLCSCLHPADVEGASSLRRAANGLLRESRMVFSIEQVSLGPKSFSWPLAVHVKVGSQGVSNVCLKFDGGHPNG